MEGPVLAVEFEVVRGEPGPGVDGFNTAALPRPRMTGLLDRTLDFWRICARPHSKTLFACVRIQAKASENDKKLVRYLVASGATACICPDHC